MKILVSLFLFLSVIFSANAQGDNKFEKPIMAQFKGGDAKLNKYIQKNFVIPAAYYNQSNDFFKTIQCRFTVSKTGCIQNVIIQNADQIPEDLQLAAIELLSKMPCDLWIPASMQGKKVNMAFMKPMNVQVYANTPPPKPNKVKKVKKSKKSQKK